MTFQSFGLLERDFRDCYSEDFLWRFSSVTTRYCNIIRHTATRLSTCSSVTSECLTFKALLWKPFSLNTTHFNTHQYTATYCNTLQHTATHCDTLQHTATHMSTYSSMASKSFTFEAFVWKPFSLIATHCNTLRHTTTHCNTLQHTATHCNTHVHLLERDIEEFHIWGFTVQKAFFFNLQFAVVCHKAVCCSVLQCIATCCSVLQDVAVCCSISIVARMEEGSFSPMKVSFTCTWKSIYHIYLYIYTNI